MDLHTFGESAMQWARVALAATFIIAACPTLAQPSAAAPPALSACTACHKIREADRGGMGPNLWGIAGRRAGSANFNYSPAMKDSKLVWDRASLTAFVMNPKETIPNNRMPYAGMKDSKRAEQIVDYLLLLR